MKKVNNKKNKSVKLVEEIVNNYQETFTKLKEHDMSYQHGMKVELKKSEAQKRKETPVFSGVIKYFPLALQEVARVSFAGNEQHNPGQPLHWDKSKSTDHLDALSRHLIDAGTLDTDGVRHSGKVAWRALANLEMELEKERQNALDAMATSK